ncbi:MAG TPA: amino acid adenylation domain-containing protein, partial [Pyrinomonadaceae bacterium]
MRLADDDHALLLTMHHIVSDGWSMGVLGREMVALYDSFSRGEASPFEELAVQYGDYARWQRGWLQGEVLERQLAYWRGQLVGAPPMLELPTDRPRPPVQTYHGASHAVEFSAELTSGLRALARSEGATMFMTLLAGFQALLSRYTHQQDVVVGVDVANRTRLETEGLIGFFVNMLVLRTDLSGSPTFRELLGRVREVTLGAYAHQDVPFEKLVEELQPVRDLSRTPLFQVVFGLQNARREQLQLEGLELGASHAEGQIAKFDLTLNVVDRGEGLTVSLEYNTDLFDASTAARMLGHLERLLQAAAGDPSRLVAQLPLLPEAERRLLLEEFNATGAEFAEAARPIHELFERQAALTPDAVAVVSEAGRLSYAELNRRANKLARHLRRLGVGPETLVGVLLERAAGAIVGLLGILKAGAGYVPLDPAYPQQRLAFMLEDAGAHLLLTEQRLLGLLPGRAARVVCVDRDWERIEREDGANPGYETRPESTAYIIYTSGSTGIPKGVMIEHRSLVNFTLAATAAYGLRPSDRLLQFSSLSFDTAAEEIFTCLTVGATLVLRTAEVSYSVDALLEKCREHEVTVLDLPTAYWHELTWELSSWNLSLPATVRLVIVGGERALPERLSMWRRSAGGDVRLMNSYGPTETTVAATVSDLTARGDEEKVSLGEVPIGRPLANVKAYVLDSNVLPVPVGVAGELYVGGAALARGYLRRPGLTAERFTPDPFSAEAGARLYRTGDVVRLAGGELEYLGRTDAQVKVRGYRIELGEVESALREQEGVREAVVIAREDEAGDKRLVAYVVTGGDDAGGDGGAEGGTPARWRSTLRERLPDYMVPSAFVVMESLPLTPSGKLDRRALPAPEWGAGRVAEGG